MTKNFPARRPGVLLATLALVAAPLAAQTPAAPASPTTPAAVPPGMAGDSPVARDGRIRVQIAAQQQTVLSAEIGAKLVNLPLREGDAFRAGQTLAVFDCAIHRAQLSKAEASAEAIRRITSAIGENTGPMSYMLGEKYIAALERLGDSGNAKLVVLPADLQDAVKGLFGRKG